jgi:hypothetical protein
MSAEAPTAASSADSDYAAAGDYKSGSNGRPQAMDSYFAFMQSAADKGHAKAQYAIARCYRSGGMIIKRNRSEARRYAQLSANQNYLPAIGDCYFYGYGVPTDTQIALSLYRVAADRDDPNGMQALADWYYRNDQYNQARQTAQRAASMNYFGGVFLVGYYAETGIGGPRDLPTAVEYYRRAIDLGSTQASVNLARIYLSDEKRDQAAAFRLMESAAKQNNCMAQREVALAWFEGRADPPSIVDIDEGVRWLRMAAEDDQTAQYELANIYLTGKISPTANKTVQPDLRKAVELFEMAAADGHTAAQAAVRQLRPSSKLIYVV